MQKTLKEGPCYVCDKNDHIAKECQTPKRPNENTQANHVGEHQLVATILETSIVRRLMSRFRINLPCNPA